MTGVITQPAAFSLGFRLLEGGAVNAALATGLNLAQDAVTALAGGGATGAPLLVIGWNFIKVCASGNDSVMMPPSVIGAVVHVKNGGAQTVAIFANTTSSLPAGTLDTLNGTAGATGITVASGSTAILACTALGAWFGPVGLT